MENILTKGKKKIRLSNKESIIIIVNNNYLKEVFFNNIKINLLIIFLTISIIISENLYRENLFQFSLVFEQDLQKNSSQIILKIFKIITKFGGQYFIAVPVGLVIIFFSLIKSSVYIIGLMLCVQFHSMMKIWYGDIRPFWKETNLYKGICDGGFGNPSGLSMINTYLYLSLFVYLKDIDILKRKYIIQGFILLFF